MTAVAALFGEENKAKGLVFWMINDHAYIKMENSIRQTIVDGREFRKLEHAPFLSHERQPEMFCFPI